MAESVYKFIEIAGSSTESWEKAAVAAVETAASSLKDLRVAEVLEQDMTIEKGKVSAYRVKLKVSFKYKTD
jgi:flavin-binding protein dodecin